MTIELAKQYDRAYFDYWYRSRRRVLTGDAIGRRARLALATAEYFFDRPLRSVLDIGCGEGSWRAVLRRMRPGLRWTGVDPSDYVVRVFGKRRGIRRGSFGELAAVRLRGRFDLIVCSDVLHYLPSTEIRKGLPALVRLLGGIAWLDSLTVDDDVMGDRQGWHLRPASQYRKMFRDAGLVNVSANAWAHADWAEARVGKLEGTQAPAGHASTRG